VTVSHGPFDFPLPDKLPEKSQVRCQLNIPVDARVLLSFGHLRNGKNLDLVIRALRELPDCHLLVAGKEQSSTQRPGAWYQQLAIDLGVSDRCHWHLGFIPEDGISQYFIAADIVVLLYSADFRSASGVLNASSQFNLPVIASSGAGPLKSAVQRYSLGEWIVPGKTNLIAEGIDRISSGQRVKPNWSGYRADHSWEQNASDILENLCLSQ